MDNLQEYFEAVKNEIGTIEAEYTMLYMAAKAIVDKAYEKKQDPVSEIIDLRILMKKIRPPNEQ